MPANESLFPKKPTPPIDPVVADMVSRLSEHLQDLWQERAAIREFEGSQTRELAEALALLDVIRMHTQEALMSLVPQM